MKMPFLIIWKIFYKFLYFKNICIEITIYLFLSSKSFIFIKVVELQITLHEYLKKFKKEIDVHKALKSCKYNIPRHLNETTFFHRFIFSV